MSAPVRFLIIALLGIASVTLIAHGLGVDIAPAWWVYVALISTPVLIVASITLALLTRKREVKS